MLLVAVALVLAVPVTVLILRLVLVLVQVVVVAAVVGCGGAVSCFPTITAFLVNITVRSVSSYYYGNRRS